jgi:anaerobic dimethyl sulfoxide reductase subunit B
MRYAFHLDATACSGCQACQVACRDRNALPAGVAWRRVYEMAGGGWTRQGDAWVNDVVAYNVSVACNHCERAICVEACPTQAMTARHDGIVLIDASRCIGCRYCEWACPYAAPQYDAAAGRMTKCTACSDDVAAGVPPACVAACPLRVLDFGDAEELAARCGGTADVAPLPDPGLTLPSLLVTSRSAVTDAPAWRVTGGNGAGQGGPARIANGEEVGRAGAARPMREPSLVAFTLLGQAAAGVCWAVAAVRLLAGAQAEPLLSTPFLAIGPLLLAAVLASLLHLGTPSRASYALANVRTSWLSREILAALLLGGGWAALLLMHGAGWTPRTAVPGAAVMMTLAAVGLVYSMARVYRLRTVPAWDSPLTTASFTLTAGSVGALIASLLVVPNAAAAAAGPWILALLLVGAAACVALSLMVEAAWPAHRRATSRALGRDAGTAAATASAATRPPSHAAALIVIACVLAAGAFASPGAALLAPLQAAGIALALWLVSVQAVAERTAFYASHGRRGL